MTHILILILVLGEWGLNKISSLPLSNPTYIDALLL